MIIDDYLDAAKIKNNYRSDRKLSEHLGLKTSAVNQWRTRRAWPSDEVMIRLADKAGADPMDAILDLNIWRSHGEAVTLYTRMKKAISAALVLFALGFGGQLATPSNAQASGLNVSNQLSQELILWKIILIIYGRTLRVYLLNLYLFKRVITTLQLKHC